MKIVKYLQYYRRVWPVGLTTALLILASFFSVGAQTLKLKVTTTGAHSTFEQALSQPTEFLQNLGITPEEVQLELRPRARILVVGAGFTRDVGLVAFIDTQGSQEAKSSIQIEGAGAARVVRLVALTETQDLQQSEFSIQVTGAGSTRGINLLSPHLE